MFKDLLKTSRGVIAVEGYYEWYDPEKKNRSIQPFFIQNKQEGETLYIACLFRQEGENKKFVVMTRES